MSLAIARLHVVVTAVVASGCSFVAVHAPSRDGTVGRRFECTTSVAAPVVDTSIAALSAVAGAGVIVAGVGDSGGEDAFVTFNYIGGAILWAVAAIYTGSAWWGYATTHECRDRPEDR